MRWLLLVLVFEVVGGEIRPIDQSYRVYQSRAACDAAGNRLREEVRFPSPSWRSISICVPESAFNG